HLRELQHRVADQFALLLLDHALVRHWIVRWLIVQQRGGFIAFALGNKLSPTVYLAYFVVANIECNSPQPGREPATWLVVIALFKYPAKGFLLQILAAMWVSRHARAQIAYRVLPALDQSGERRMIVLGFNPPHRL